MSHPSLDKFGQFIVSEFWDRALEHHELLEMKHWRSPRMQALQDSLAEMDEAQRGLVRICLYTVLEAGIHGFLAALQRAHENDEDIEVRVQGQDIAQLSKALERELLGENGWLARYSAYAER